MIEKVKRFSLLYGIFSLAVLLVLNLYPRPWVWYLRPIPVLLLFLFFYQHNKQKLNKFSFHILLGLGLNVVSDLLYANNLHYGIMLTAISLGMLAHITYILAFQYFENKMIPWYQLKNIKPTWGIIALIALIISISIIYSFQTKGLELMIALYSLILLILNIQALKRFDQTTRSSFIYILLGTAFMSVGDLILALITTAPVEASKTIHLSLEILISIHLFFYFLAQYFITTGAIYQEYKIE